MKLVYLIYYLSLLRGVVAVWYESVVILHGWLVVFTVLHCFFCEGVFHHPVSFVWFVEKHFISLQCGYDWTFLGTCITGGS